MTSVPPLATIATIAEYFRIGLLVGLLEPTQAIAWADSEIAAADLPADGVIDVAWSKGTASTMDALSVVPGERNKQLAGRWLLGLLGTLALESEEDLQLAVQRAMAIARHSELEDETYYRFDMIDDGLFLATSGAYGTVAQCRNDLAAALVEFESLKLDKSP